jgi:hypothetical protein
MKRIQAINKKAARVAKETDMAQHDVFALQRGNPTGGNKSESTPHYPTGCSLTFFPGWEVDSTGGTAGLCQPVERDLYDCYADCFWPAQVPDHLNRYPDWSKKCAAATQDWRNLDVVFP